MSFRIWLSRALGITASPKIVEKIAGPCALPARLYNTTIARIIILKLDHLGDFFVSVKALTMLRDAWPQAEITLVCGPWNVQLAETLGIFDKILPFKFFGLNAIEQATTKRRDYAEISKVIDSEYDLAIDLRHDADTRKFLDYIPSRFRAGYAARKLNKPLDLALPNVEPKRASNDLVTPLHAETRLTLLAAITIDIFGPKTVHPIHRLLSNGAPRVPFRKGEYAVIASGAGSPLRQWGIDQFVKLALSLIENFELQIVLIGGSGDRAANAGLAARLSADECCDLTDMPIVELPALIKDAKLFVGNDTGTSHLAALLDVPTVCIYAGVSSPDVWQPLGGRSSIVHAKTSCAYCRLALPKQCKNGNICMSAITVDDVLNEVRRLIGPMRQQLPPEG
jgi:ADP-heptose:LPS heptosyltransferase